ncbi:MAG: TolC family protein [Melioribacteraceae bacterium]|nr:TolC family protein [Melioribacteraceae bacterium]
MRFFIILFCFTNVLFAQKILTLEDALNIALKESYNIKAAEYSLESSKKSLEAVKLGLLSRVDLEFDLPDYSRSLASRFNPITEKDEYYNIGSTRLQSRLFVTQPLIFSNGTISVVGSVYGRDQFIEGSNDARDYFSNLNIMLRQPLFTFNTQKANLERAEVNLNKSERNYTQAERNIIYEVTAGFFNLYKSKRNAEIQKEKVKQSEISFVTAENKFKAGLIAEVEKMQLEVDLASSRNQLLDAERTYEENKNEFKYLIGLELDDNIDVKENLAYEIVKIDINAAIKSALKNSPDLLNSEDDIFLRELSVDETDSRSTIKADITAVYGINKNDEQFDNIFRQFEDNRSVVMTLSVPVFDWGQNSREVQSAEANLKLTKEYNKNLKVRIKKEIISAVNRIKSAEARVDVLSKTVNVAQESYDISLERFKAGKITSFDLSQMQLRLTDSKLNSLAALIDYKLALADLERKALMKFN